MNWLTYGDLKSSGMAKRLNLCADDDRFRDAVNRATRLLLLHGSWHGTLRIVQLRVDDFCIVLPGCVANLEGVYTPCGPVNIRGIGYQFLPGWRPLSACGSPVEFIEHDMVPTQKRVVTPGLIRTYPSSLTDVGRTVTYLGYRSNGTWIRTKQSGVFKDGEKVTIASPYVDTTIQFASVASVLKDETDSEIRAYTLQSASVPMYDLATYEYWETRPMYRRYKLPRYREVSACACNCAAVEALVKLDFIPVKRDEDTLLIQNFMALELAMEALKYKDSGELAQADALLFGTRDNKRLGAIPMLQQELRTYGADNFHGHVSVQAPWGMRRVMAGFS